jgi:glycosyltransferase involved in cell wall biosynthesis
VRPSNWTSVGLFPSVTLFGKDEPSTQISKPYFIYPAQKWFHKNHKILLEALQILKQKGIEAQLVFTGLDKGSGKFVSSKIAELDISDRIEDLGFVDENQLNNLIINAVALVMPTFLGPTNLPPLEAALMGTRVLASDVHDFDQEDLNGIDLTLIPADSDVGWANAMQKCLEEPKQNIDYKPRDSSSSLSKVFETLSEKISNWQC